VRRLNDLTFVQSSLPAEKACSASNKVGGTLSRYLYTASRHQLRLSVDWKTVISAFMVERMFLSAASASVNDAGGSAY